MKVRLHKWDRQSGWDSELVVQEHSENRLLIAFASGDARESELLAEVLESYPGATVFGASSAGEIYKNDSYRNSLVVSVVDFEKTKLESAIAAINSPEESGKASTEALKKLPRDGLRHVLYFADGLGIAHAQIINSIRDYLPEGVKLTGGFCGSINRDYTANPTTGGWEKQSVAVLGLYGDALRVGSACNGAGTPFGPVRQITKAEGNVIYELDNKPALAVLRDYLGLSRGQDLSIEGNYYHFVIKENLSSPGIIRGFVDFDDDEGSITFGGEINNGQMAQISRSGYENLIDTAAAVGEELANFEDPQFGLLVSCVSRGLILNQRAGEEVEEVKRSIGSEVPLVGFYAYGELGPSDTQDACSLHNETINLTIFSEN